MLILEKKPWDLEWITLGGEERGGGALIQFKGYCNIDAAVGAMLMIY